MAQPGECPCRCRAPKFERATRCVSSQCNRTELWREILEPLAMRPKKRSVSGRRTARTINTITEQQAQDTHGSLARHTRRTPKRKRLEKTSGPYPHIVGAAHACHHGSATTSACLFSSPVNTIAIPTQHFVLMEIQWIASIHHDVHTIPKPTHHCRSIENRSTDSCTCSSWKARATAGLSQCGAAVVVSAVTRTLDLGVDGIAREKG